VDGRAVSDPVEFRILFRIQLEIVQHGPQEMCNVIVEGHRGQTMTGSGSSFIKRGIQREFEKHVLAKRYERGRGGPSFDAFNPS
jgi:hypothetical protein